MSASGLGGILRRAWRLDLDDANYATSSERLGLYRYAPATPWRRNVSIAAVAFFAKLLRASLSHRTPYPRTAPCLMVRFVLGSRNQWHAVAPVLEGFSDARVLRLHRDVPGDPFPDAAAYLWSLPFLPRVWKWRQTATGYRRIGFDVAFDRYWLTFGFYVAASRLLARERPRLVVVANDHSMESRVVMLAARDLGIKTAYMQHASASRDFPPLAFDLVLLDGVDAAEKYDRATRDSPTVYLTGIPKADQVRRCRRSPSHDLATLGVCVNVLDPTESVVALLGELATLAAGVTLLLRPHPSDARDWPALAPDVSCSDARNEPSFAFLRRVDGIVSGASNIILEAALADVPAVFVDFAGSGREPYGFVARGLCGHARDAGDALRLLRDHDVEQVAPALRAYCATICTNYDGRSADLVRELLSQHAAGSVDRSRWMRRSGFEYLEVLELRSKEKGHES